MIVYWLGFLLAFLAYGASVFRLEKAVSFSLLCMTVFYWTLAIGLRWKTGNDFEQYLYIFQSGRYVEVEPGFAMVNWIVDALDSGAGHLLFFVTALISVVLKVSSFSRWREASIGLFVFVSTYAVAVEMNLVRQAIALGFVLLAYRFLLEEKLRLFVLLVLVAASFHVSALVSILVLLLHRRGFDARMAFLLVSIAVVCALFSVVSVLVEGVAVRIVEGGDKAAFYLLNGDAFGYVAGPKLGWLKKGMLLAYYCWATKAMRGQRDADVAMWGITTAYFFYFFFDPYGDLAKRLPMYFEIFEIFLIPCILLRSAGSRQMLHFAVISCLLFGKFFAFFGDSGAMAFVPYRNIIFDLN